MISYLHTNNDKIHPLLHRYYIFLLLIMIFYHCERRKYSVHRAKSKYVGEAHTKIVGNYLILFLFFDWNESRGRFIFNAHIVQWHLNRFSVSQKWCQIQFKIRKRKKPMNRSRLPRSVRSMQKWHNNWNDRGREEEGARLHHTFIVIAKQRKNIFVLFSRRK